MGDTQEWEIGQTERKYVIYQEHSLPPYRKTYFWNKQAEEAVEIDGQKARLFSGEEFYFIEWMNSCQEFYPTYFSGGGWRYEELCNIEKYKRVEPISTSDKSCIASPAEVEYSPIKKIREWLGF